jgi:ParB-like nuclease family protein
MYIALERIVMDERYYPRNGIFWRHIAELLSALRVNQTLPPIVVGKRDQRYVIIDGRHRYEAHKALKANKIAVLVTKLPETQWFAEAVRLNTAHGHGLSYQEKIAAAMQLRRLSFADKQIESIVRIPLDRLNSAIEERGRWLKPEDIRPLVIKGGITEAVKEKGGKWLLDSGEALQEQQARLSGTSVRQLATELTVMLRNDLIIREERNLVLLAELRAALENWMALGNFSVETYEAGQQDVSLSVK